MSDILGTCWLVLDEGSHEEIDILERCAGDCMLPQSGPYGWSVGYLGYKQENTIHYTMLFGNNGWWSKYLSQMVNVVAISFLYFQGNLVLGFKFVLCEVHLGHV